MKFLLDVNALISLRFERHAFHDRMGAWLKENEGTTLVTCSIVELGFVRILSQTSAYAFTVDQARSLLEQLKQSPVLGFIADDLDLTDLPKWVKSRGQTTDGHLAQLAKAHGCLLATFNSRIPGAYAIP